MKNYWSMKLLLLILFLSCGVGVVRGMPDGPFLNTYWKQYGATNSWYLVNTAGQSVIVAPNDRNEWGATLNTMLTGSFQLFQFKHSFEANQWAAYYYNGTQWVAYNISNLKEGWHALDKKPYEHLQSSAHVPPAVVKSVAQPLAASHTVGPIQVNVPPAPADMMWQKAPGGPKGVILFYAKNDPFGIFPNTTALDDSALNNLFQQGTDAILHLQSQIDGELKGAWKTSEGCFQSYKFTLEKPQNVAQRLSETNARTLQGMDSATFIKKIGTGFAIDWQRWDNDVRFKAMYEAVYSKFSQHQFLKALLIATGECILVEHTITDKDWGDAFHNGSTGRGLAAGKIPGNNFLGATLMLVRHELKNDIPMNTQRDIKQEILKYWDASVNGQRFYTEFVASKELVYGVAHGYDINTGFQISKLPDGAYKAALSTFYQDVVAAAQAAIVPVPLEPPHADVPAAVENVAGEGVIGQLKQAFTALKNALTRMSRRLRGIIGDAADDPVGVG